MPRKKNARTPERREKFISALAAGATVADAAKSAGIARETAYLWRKSDDTFAAEWDEAYAQGGDTLAKEAHRRAVEGVEEPILCRGEIVGYTRKYSDVLLIFLMKAREPERYCDRMRASAILRRWATRCAPFLVNIRNRVFSLCSPDNEQQTLRSSLQISS